MNLSSVDLNLVVVLHAVLDEGGVARAAKRLGVTPPAVSNALARLRGLMNDPLFVRSGRGLSPTPRAREVAPLLSRALSELEHVLEDSARFDARTTTRELAIALTDGDHLATLPAIARAFAAEFPQAKLRVVSVDTLVAEGGLEGSGIDVAVGPPQAGEGLHSKPLYDTEGVLIVRRDHPRIGDRMTAEAFRAERHVDVHLALGKGGAGNRVAKDAFARMGLERDIAVTVPTFLAAAVVVGSTDFISGMPRLAAEAITSSIPIRVVRGPMPALTFPLHLLWHARTDGDPASARLRDLIVAAVGGGAKRPRKPPRAEALRRGRRSA